MGATSRTTDAEAEAVMTRIGHRARAAAMALAKSDAGQRVHALQQTAATIRERSEQILQANAMDLATPKARKLSGSMLDRLQLTTERVEATAVGVEQVAALADPVGQVIADWDRPNGLRIQRVRVPLGVIGIIYESRPNVTADAGALCLKSGNAVILRGGSESFHSSSAIHACFAQALEQASLPADAVQMVPTRSRDAVGMLLAGLDGCIDVVVPRGGKNLIARVQQDARVPVIGHLEGLCHVYVHPSADVRMAADIVLNAKMRRTGICGAAESLLIDRDALGTHLPAIIDALDAAGCELRGDDDVRAIDARVGPVTEADWTTEYLDAILSIRTVAGIDAAIHHIETHGSGHTDAIVAEDQRVVERFFRDLDSAILIHNASTQFADGGEFGMGAEIGIATGRIHARGPVGAEQLTSFKYVVRGSGQTRP